jgi:hypothetical protein
MLFPRRNMADAKGLRNRAESASNDGLAYPFLSISIYLAVETSKKVAFGKWFLIGWLCEWRSEFPEDVHVLTIP